MGFGAGLAGGAVVSIVIKAVDEYSKEFDNVNKVMGEVNTKLLGAGAAITAVGVAGGVMLAGWAEKAAVAGDVQEAFNKKLGTDAPEALRAMKEATLGTISDVDLMKASNQALARGVNKELIPSIAKYAMQAKDAGVTNGSVADTIDEITSAIASGRTVKLKQLGIIIDTDKAYQDYAISIGKSIPATKEVATAEAEVAKARIEEINRTEEGLKLKLKESQVLKGSSAEKDKLKQAIDRQLLALDQEKFSLGEVSKATMMVTEDGKSFKDILSAEEQQAALSAAAITSIGTASEKLPAPTKDFADSMAALNASFTNMSIVIGNAVAPAFMYLAEQIQGLFNWFQSLSPEMQTWIGYGIAIISVLALIAGPILMLIAVLPALAAGFTLVSVGLGAITIAGAPLWIILLAIIAVIAAIIIAFKNWDTIIGTLKATWEDFKNGLFIIWDAIKAKVTEVWDFIINKINAAIDAVKNFLSSGFDAVMGGGSSKGGTAPKSTKVHDFILQPGGKLIETDPRDTIMGLKNYGGGSSTGQSINVSIGTIQGMNPDDIAQALRMRLGDLIAT